MRILMALAMIVAAGCTGDLTDLGVAKGGGAGAGGGGGGSGGSSGGSAGTGGGTGGSGGAAPMGKVTFADIQKDFDSFTPLSCTSTACHDSTAAGSGGAVYYLKGMATGADLTKNYMDTMMELTTMPAGMEAQSGLLINVLAGGNPPQVHTGGIFFQSTSDPIYVKWLNWIKAGAPQQ